MKRFRDVAQAVMVSAWRAKLDDSKLVRAHKEFLRNMAHGRPRPDSAAPTFKAGGKPERKAQPNE